jgi:3-hydroxybutyryl-CoA dehydrogenase
MQLAVLANVELKEEFLACGIHEACKIEWFSSTNELAQTHADAVFDLLFEINGYDVSYLRTFSDKPIFVNSVTRTIKEIGMPFFRINGWPGFLKRELAEVSCADGSQRKSADDILSLINRKAEWVPDITGFVSARVVSMIINEAYLAKEEDVSTKEEIDIAMKLGTNYPYGPFEWAKKIGLKNIADLLSALRKHEKRYEPSKLLLTEAGK